MSNWPQHGTAAALALTYIEENPNVTAHQITKYMGWDGRKTKRVVDELVNRRVVASHTNGRGALVLSSWEYHDEQWG